MIPNRKKRKTDYAALSSPFMRVPKADIRAARALLDLGYREVYELRGRDPEVVFSDLKKLGKKPDDDLLGRIKIIVDFAESGDTP